PLRRQTLQVQRRPALLQVQPRRLQQPLDPVVLPLLALALHQLQQEVRVTPRLRRRLTRHRLVLAPHRRQTQLLQATRQHRRHVRAHRSPPCSDPPVTCQCHSTCSTPPPGGRRTPANLPPPPTPGPPPTTGCHCPAMSRPPARSTAGLGPAAWP